METPAPPEPTPLGTAGPLSQRLSRFLTLLKISSGVYPPFASPSESSFSICPPSSHLFRTDFASHLAYRSSALEHYPSSSVFHHSGILSPLLLPPKPLAFVCLHLLQKQGARTPRAAQTREKPPASKHHININKCHLTGIKCDLICIRNYSEQPPCCKIKAPTTVIMHLCYFSAPNTVLPTRTPNSQQRLLCKGQTEKMFPSSSSPCTSLNKHKMSILRMLGTLQHSLHGRKGLCSSPA